MSAGFPGRLVLMGHPLGHSFSPRFQNAALDAAGIPLRYELLDVPRSALDATIEQLRRDRAAGNVTVPYKEAVCARCDRLTSTARTIGAVNTFWTAVDGALVGDNTDAPGFDAAVREFLGGTPPGAIALLGAGGAAAAALHAMKGWDGVQVRVHTRTRARAVRLLERLAMPDAAVVDSIEDALDGASLFVQATPVGLHGDEMPIDVALLPAGIAVFDIVYRAGDTLLVRQARARGLRATDGAGMLVAQGALAFERWFGTQPDRRIMWEAIQQDVS